MTVTVIAIFGDPTFDADREPQVLLGDIEGIGAGVNRAIVIDAVINRIVINEMGDHCPGRGSRIRQPVQIEPGVMRLGQNLVERTVSVSNCGIIAKHALKQVAVGIVAAAFDRDCKCGVADIRRIVER